MEIGVWNGKNSLKMILAAMKNHPKDEVYYYGFDLFESMTDEVFKKDLGKTIVSKDVVNKKLRKTGVHIYLSEGNTMKTLHEITLPLMDFVFIDGGHSFETVSNDWKYVQRVMGKHTVVVFDDYWNRSVEGVHGVKKLIDSIDRDEFVVELLSPQDVFTKEDGVLVINLIKVIRK